MNKTTQEIWQCIAQADHNLEKALDNLLVSNDVLELHLRIAQNNIERALSEIFLDKCKPSNRK
jgi:hypothetical protein